jgi:alkylhydroperoxidase/carboxymuconolactone decarboxylase family protein YurZ
MMAQPQATPWQTVLEQNAPDLLKNVLGVREAVLQEGALSLKVKIMMTMLCDALLGHADGVANIANRARAAGATEEEIAETVGVAFLFGGTPALVTAANAFRK